MSSSHNPSFEPASESQPSDSHDGLTAEDHAYRHAALAYFSEKGKIAASSFDPSQLGVFRSFEEHWKEFFGPTEPEQLREYLASPFEVRKSRFERFKRECRAWEISFRLSARRSAHQRVTSDTGELSDIKRRVNAQREKADQVREFYDNLDSKLDRERQRQSFPLELVPHFRMLELPPSSTVDDVKKQYKRLARLHHPDVSGDPLKMSSLNNAYRVIMKFWNNGSLTGSESL